MSKTARTTIDKCRVVAVDFETAWSYDHIVEIGGVELLGAKKTGRVFHRLVKSTVPNRMRTFGIHGIRTSQLSAAHSFREVADEFLDFIADSPIVAHKEDYERHTLQRELERIGRSAPDRQRFICTLKMAKAAGRFENCKLETVARQLGVYRQSRRKGFHDALTDAHMAADIYLRLRRDSSTSDRLPNARVRLTKQKIRPYHDIRERPGSANLKLQNKFQSRSRTRRLHELLHEKGDVNGYISLLMEGYE